MPARIRLQRHGKKKNVFFHLVVADGRAPRDGKFIEKIGTYYPLTNPATIDIDFDKSLAWLQNGAQPSDTARAILRYKGVMYKYHLLGGVAKGALTLEAAEAKFTKWLTEKQNKVETKRSGVGAKADQANRDRLKRESAVKEAISAKVAAKSAPAVEEAPAAEETAAPESNEA
jgi:small subunit ribosomal protein S16